MTVYIENPKEVIHTHKKNLELLNQSTKVARSKISMQKSVLFLYTSNEKFKLELMKQFHFIICNLLIISEI